jgi:hypothetical protein
VQADHDMIVVPSHFFKPEIIEARQPLPKTAHNPPIVSTIPPPPSPPDPNPFNPLRPALSLSAPFSPP